MLYPHKDALRILNSTSLYIFLSSKKKKDSLHFRVLVTNVSPHGKQPASWLRAMTDDNANPSCPIKIAHGTTTLAFRFKGGIIVATDSRATAGNWIASQTVKKVIEINNCLLGTMAGGAADCQYWLAYLGMQCRLHELRHKRRISVAAASKILANLVYSYKGMGLSMVSLF